MHHSQTNFFFYTRLYYQWTRGKEDAIDECLITDNEDESSVRDKSPKYVDINNNATKKAISYDATCNMMHSLHFHIYYSHNLLAKK
jgi:hypothetical protein